MRDRKYKAIFFDADDTLFDYPGAERAALAACRREFRLRVAPVLVLSSIRDLPGRLGL